ncbi:hypothetical protein ACO0SA_002166 [Hanseniaspora valbyensis]
MSEHEKKDEFFKPVGELVEETAGSKVPDNIQQDPNDPNVLYYSEPKDGETPVTTIDSLCMQCHNPHGKTNLLMTTIPHFKKIIIMSFECDKCGFKNNEIQTGNDLQVKGVLFNMDINKLLNNGDNYTKDLADFMNRQIVKSAYGVVSFQFIPLDQEKNEIVQFEIPKGKAQLSTVEGLMMDTILDLQALQHLRKYQNVEAYEKINELIHCVYSLISKNNNGKLEEIVDGQEQKIHESIEFDSEKVKKYSESINEIKVTIRDPSGNSFLEFKPFEEGSLISYNKKEFFRDDEDNFHIGLITQDQLEEKKVLNQVVDKYLPKIDEKSKDAASDKLVDEFVNDIETFVDSCPSCLDKHCITNMKPLNIPHFKQVLIMSTKCDKCGYKSNEVKTGGGISQYGKKTILTITEETIEEDLKRDLLKSETCKLFIPQIHLDIQEGTLGGRFTTLEGILKQVYDELYERIFQESYDSMEQETRDNWLSFFGNLSNVMSGKLPVGQDKIEVILIDPLANSYLQNIYAPDEDPNIVYKSFKRTKSQNEDLGILELLRQEGLSEGEDEEEEVEVN